MPTPEFYKKMHPSSELMRFRNEFVRTFKRIEYNTTPGDAQMLRILVESFRAKSGLEIGAATGYGAIVMGLGFERNGGHLTSIDIAPDMVAAARKNIRAMKLQKTVAVVQGAALKKIPKLAGPFDFVFIDAIKNDYHAYFRAIEPKLKRKAIVVADNVIQHADKMQDFLEAVSNDPRYQSVIIRASEEKGDGMMVIYKS